jgi:hypothetical protein
VSSGGLRRDGGPRGAEGAYYATGALKGITGSGKRIVRALALRRLCPGEDLAVLRSFGDLKTLELEHVRDVDMCPLAGLGIEHLTITEATGIDLAPLAELAQLRSLILGNMHDIDVPRLRLAPSLRLLVVLNDDPELTGQPVRQVIESIDWSRLTELRSLSLRVGGLYEMPSIEVDFGFLRCLPHLESLDMYAGLRHIGPSPSPTAPPFDGLSRKLTVLRIVGDEPAAVREALCAYLGADPDNPQTSIVVSGGEDGDQRAPTASWTITGPIDGIWTTYGSLHRAENGTAEDTEYEACKRAEERLLTRDAALIERLDFDPESAGTGIMAKSREDLERALKLLQLDR